jgi:hypothetical protein
MYKNKYPQSVPPQGRVSPRISINKLGEYLTATPARRRSIIKDQKYPPEIFVTGKYNDAFDHIIDFFVRDALDPEGLHRAVAVLSSRPTRSDPEAADLKNNILALQRLIKTADSLPFADLTFRAAKQQGALLTIGKVAVSIRPELEIVAPQRGGGTKYGLLKLYLGKTHPLNEDSGQLIATTVHQFAEQHFGSPDDVDRKRCYVLDVFQGKLFVAPASYTKRRSDIEAACEEIAARWPTL